MGELGDGGVGDITKKHQPFLIESISMDDGWPLAWPGQAKLALVVFNGHIFLGVLPSLPLSYYSACREREVCSWGCGGGETRNNSKTHHPLQSLLLSNHGLYFWILGPRVVEGQ